MYKVNRPHQAAARYKTKLCCGWLANGHCPYEFKCMFAHGDHELRTKEMNLADGLTHDEAVRAHQWRLWAAGYGATGSEAGTDAKAPLATRRTASELPAPATYPKPPAPIDADDDDDASSMTPAYKWSPAWSSESSSECGAVRSELGGSFALRPLPCCDSAAALLPQFRATAAVTPLPIARPARRMHVSPLLKNWKK